MLHRFCSLAAAIVACVSLSAAQDYWQPTAGPYGGTLTVFASTSPGTLYAGAFPGLYRSTDDGTTWSQIGIGTPIEQASVLALAVNSTDIIFAGLSPGGIYRSTDDGATWTEMNMGLTDMNVSDLVINAMGHIFAATASGVFRSLDNAATWVPVNTGLASGSVRTITVDNNGQLYAGLTTGVFESTDNGDNWSAMSSGLTDPNIMDLTVSPPGSGIHSANQLAAATFAGVFLFNRTSRTWEPFNNGLTVLLVYALIFNAQGDLFAATGGGGIFKLLAGASVWVAANTGLLPYVYFTALFVTTAGHLFTAADWGGCHRSIDNGSSWVRLFVGLTAYSAQMFFYSATLGYLFLGTNAGLFYSANTGVLWNLINHPEVFFWVTTMAYVGGYLFAGTYFNGISRSSDGGATWNPVNNGLTSLFITALVVDAVGRLFAATSGGGVFMSTNMGDSWSAINTNLTDLAVTCLVIGALGYIYAGTISSGVFRLDPTTLNWTQVIVGLTTLYVTRLFVDFLGNIFAGTNGGGVFRTATMGASWVAAGLVSLFIYDLIGRSLGLDGSNGELFAATNSGLYRSTDLGDNWAPITTGLPNGPVNRLGADSAGNVFAAVSGHGVYMNGPATSVKSIDKEIPDSFVLEQNYPNPFNPSTTIQFSLPRAASVSLKIYDPLGQEVATLVDGQMPPGNYSADWSPKGIASGVYFYRLKTGEFSKTRKLMLVK